MTEPNFTFALSDTPDRATLLPLYRAIMGPGPKPTVSLGSVTRAEAEAWLDRVHLTYKQGLESRSALITKMRLPDRVTLTGLSDGDAP